MRRGRMRWLELGGLLVLALVPPVAAALDQPFYVDLFTTILIFAIAAVSLDLILGYGGMVSFGHAAYLGIGSYAVGILAYYGFTSGPLQFAAAIGGAALAALAIGTVSLRTTGVYFIMITLAFSQMIYFLCESLNQFGGDNGLNISSHSWFGRGLDLDDGRALYYLTLECLVVFLWFCRRVVDSRFGMVLRGTRSNPRRMAALGFPTFRYQLTAFVIAGAGGGLAGALLANQTLFLSPSIMHWTRSGEIMMMVIMGGMGTLFGPVLGAIAYLLLQNVLSGWTAHWQAVLGPLLVLLVLFSRGGMLGLFRARHESAASLEAEGRAKGSSRQTLAATPSPFLDPLRGASPQGERERRGSDALLSASGLVKRFGGLVATDLHALDILPGEVHALIGPNGAGKTTLVAQLAGEQRPDAGAIRFLGRDMTHEPPARRAAQGLARSFQISSVFAEFSALDNVALAVQARAGHSFRFWRAARRDPALREPARHFLDQVGLAEQAAVPAGVLSHGDRRALELAMVLAGQPRVLLLDEPMAGMGPEDSARMVTLLAGLKGHVAMLLVEHDMDAVFALADRITVLVYGRAIATGAPDAIRQDPAVLAAYLGADA